MRTLSNILISLVLYMSFIAMANAETKKIHISLAEIVAVDLMEESGDEVYFSITEYASSGKNQQDRVPIFPKHWLSKNLSEVKNVILWEKEIRDNESYDLIISLIEHDAPPWNVDDHIGSVRVEVNNLPSKLKIDWKVADYFDQPIVKQAKPNYPEYVFKTDHSEYKVKFELISG